MPDNQNQVYVAINMSKVANTPQSLATMQTVGPKVCILTASNPGFLGYQSHIQTGVLPLAGRYGGASLRMRAELNPIRLYQYTMWDSVDSHSKFHKENFARVFELCYACLSMVVEGPWEPIYRIVAARMPPIRTSGQVVQLIGEAQDQQQAPPLVTPTRTVALAEHIVKPNRKQAFEKGVVNTLEAISSAAPGFSGYMVLEQIGVNPLGSLMLDPNSMIEMLETLGANPPTDPKPLFEASKAAPTPPEYLVHTEWDTPELAQQGLGLTLVNREIRTLHNQGVVAHLIRGPYVMLFDPMMEEPSWRRRLG